MMVDEMLYYVTTSVEKAVYLSFVPDCVFSLFGGKEVPI